MSNKYVQTVNSNQTRFTQAPMGELEYSRFSNSVKHTTDFSAGNIIPIYCNEVLPHDTWDMSCDFVIRQATALVPSMDQMECDIYAFFVPNRVVNHSWVNVMGENSAGTWTAPQVSLVPLVNSYTQYDETIQIPVNSVADYYGYPTQQPLPRSVLAQCHDLKFRGYLSIYNEYFRDQNYQPPIPFSKLNIYNGFMEPVGTLITLNRNDDDAFVVNESSVPPADGFIATGDVGNGAVAKALYGDGARFYDMGVEVNNYQLQDIVRYTSFSALSAPLKANKKHDYFTSVLPSPQKGPAVVISNLSLMPVITGDVPSYYPITGEPLHFASTNGDSDFGNHVLRDWVLGVDTSGFLEANETQVNSVNGAGFPVPNNLFADPSNSTITLDDLRMSAAVQQVYEVLGRGGSRYREYINSFFGLDIDDPFSDIPVLLGHYSRGLDLYQTAQTSASQEGSAQGSLAAFGYTNSGGHLFTKTFNEHGYVHVFAVVRHKNVYPSTLSRDNFRLSMLDFYQYPLANISEQPVYTREINPFVADADAVFGYQEAWAEYRMESDKVSGHMRTGVQDSLAFWNFADSFDSTLTIADADWLKSNSAEVLNRSIAIADTYQPQFKGMFQFGITKQRAMPTYSVAGLDII